MICGVISCASSPRKGHKVATSREEFLRSTWKNEDEAEARLRQRIEEEIRAAMSRQDKSLSVELTDNPACLNLNKVIDEYQMLGWTVSQSQHRTERYLDFS